MREREAAHAGRWSKGRIKSAAAKSKLKLNPKTVGRANELCWANTLSSSSFVGGDGGRGVARGRSPAVFASASGHIVGSMKYSFIYNSQQRIDSCAAAPAPAPARKSRFKLNL